MGRQAVADVVLLSAESEPLWLHALGARQAELARPSSMAASGAWGFIGEDTCHDPPFAQTTSNVLVFISPDK